MPTYMCDSYPFEIQVEGENWFSPLTHVLKEFSNSV